MSSLGTSSPVSASTLAYLIRWPVFRLSWLNEIFSLSEVAGYSATGQVTSDSRRKPFQLARGAMIRRTPFGGARTQDERHALVPTLLASHPHLFFWIFSQNGLNNRSRRHCSRLGLPISLGHGNPL